MAKTLDTLLNEFTEAWIAGERPRVDDYIERVPIEDRDELAELISAFLELAPDPDYSSEQLAELRADPTVQKIGELFDSKSGLWPALLPRLRARVELTREQVVARLTELLGVPGRE